MAAAIDVLRLACLLDVRDVVPRMAVQRLLHALLVEEVANQSDGSGHDEEAVQAPVSDRLVDLLFVERAR